MQSKGTRYSSINWIGLVSDDYSAVAGAGHDPGRANAEERNRVRQQMLEPSGGHPLSGSTSWTRPRLILCRGTEQGAAVHTGVIWWASTERQQELDTTQADLVQRKGIGCSSICWNHLVRTHSAAAPAKTLFVGSNFGGCREQGAAACAGIIWWASAQLQQELQLDVQDATSEDAGRCSSYRQCHQANSTRLAAIRSGGGPGIPCTRAS